MDLAFVKGSDVKVDDLAVEVTGPAKRILNAESLQLRKSRTHKGAVISFIPNEEGFHNASFVSFKYRLQQMAASFCAFLESF